jgi:Ca2+/Na+ antiporter
MYSKNPDFSLIIFAITMLIFAIICFICGIAFIDTDVSIIFFIGWIISLLSCVSLFYYYYYCQKKRKQKIDLESESKNQAEKVKIWRQGQYTENTVIINKNENILIRCNACQREISKNAVACPHCGEPLPRRCPKCGSLDIIHMSGFQKGSAVVAFGVFSANTVLNDFQCKECRTKFK